MPATIIQPVPNWRSSTHPSPMHVSTEKKIDSPAAYAMLLPRAASRSWPSPFSGSLKGPRASPAYFVSSLRRSSASIRSAFNISASAGESAAGTSSSGPASNL